MKLTWHDVLCALRACVCTQAANAQDERDEAVKAKDAAVRDRDAAKKKVGEE